ncbi:MAG: hypothetical protein U0Y68_09375 [Blastocatellia bacterium]
MSTIAEIETAIAGLPPAQVEELADWLAAHRAQRAAQWAAEKWLQQARGAALPDTTTAEVMTLTRGEE